MHLRFLSVRPVTKFLCGCHPLPAHARQDSRVKTLSNCGSTANVVSTKDPCITIADADFTIRDNRQSEALRHNGGCLSTQQLAITDVNGCLMLLNSSQASESRSILISLCSDTQPCLRSHLSITNTGSATRGSLRMEHSCTHVGSSCLQPIIQWHGPIVLRIRMIDEPRQLAQVLASRCNSSVVNYLPRQCIPYSVLPPDSSFQVSEK
ncbi:hypothetical protein DE146DRAFT_413169 [Phaeosphaeria sp. MPI-PUGE-AT-0046c]|nr:hypothetical protein DE146DRAFT_413169 [Phaeosphaeria sp. MPI-PUGE-AT-0046c]